MGVCGKCYALATLPLGNTWYALCRRWHQDQSGRVQKTSPLPGFDTLNVQPIASRCADCAILAHAYENVGY